MSIDVVALCLTIAASAGGVAWMIGSRLSGMEKGMTARMDGFESRLANVESDIHDIRADVRSINEYLRTLKPQAG